MGPASDTWHDERALARFEVFLFSAVATVLITRAFLAVTGYPQVGGNGLHVAHVLWGGLLMGVAIVVVEILPGSRARLRAALIGGIGFGLFIDEIGKFLTKDVNYFFKPAIAIIYAIFVASYLLVREFLLHRRLTDRRRLALAATALTDLALGQLDRGSRDYAVRLLDGVDETGGLAAAAHAVRDALHAEAPAQPGFWAWLERTRERFETQVERVLGSRLLTRLVLVLFGIEALDTVISAIFSIINRGSLSIGRAVLDTGLPSVISGVLIVIGVARLRRNRASALRMLQRAILIDLLFTQVVVFNREQWLGLVGFTIDIVVFWVLRLALRNEDGRRQPS